MLKRMLRRDGCTAKELSIRGLHRIVSAEEDCRCKKFHEFR